MRHLHRRELRFLGLLGLTGLLITLHLASGLEGLVKPAGGWRTLDRTALERRIESGDLREREADWYRPAMGGEATGRGPGDRP
ncbi:MAG: hypothetical protein ACM3ST_08165 [Bdellovibrio bacteriovorus]